MRKRAMVDRESSISWSRWLLPLVLLCFMPWNVFSQKVSTLLSKEKIVLGEQIVLQVKVEGLAPGSIQQDFVFPDTVNHIEILSDSVQEIGNSEIIHTLTLTSFDSGYWQLPSFKMLLNDRRILTTEPLGITVLPIDISNLQDYHDIKDILEIQPQNNWWIVAAIVAAALLSLFAVLWFMGNGTGSADNTVRDASKLESLYREISRRLEVYASSDFRERHHTPGFFTETSMLARTFTDVAYGKRTSHLTSGEYMLQMKGKLPDTEAESRYYQFLRLADAVKFAKYQPPVDEVRDALAVVKNTVNVVYEQSKQVG